jgi:peptide/nickel transport system substrate-binding protein
LQSNQRTRQTRRHQKRSRRFRLQFAPEIRPAESFAAELTHTLVIAAPTTPQSLDHEFDVSLGTIDTVGALYDNLLEYEKIPDPQVPDALREDIAVHSDKPYNLNLKGKPAEKWEISSDGTLARFFLRPGIMSNWGNELTADDVKWTWDRKLHLTGLGPFQAGVLNITQEDQIQVSICQHRSGTRCFESTCEVSFCPLELSCLE